MTELKLDVQEIKEKLSEQEKYDAPLDKLDITFPMKTIDELEKLESIIQTEDGKKQFVSGDFYYLLFVIT